MVIVVKYYNDSQITGSKLNIGKRVPSDAAVLGYAAAPEITSQDFAINILYADNSFENRYVPVIDSYGDYTIDISNILNYKELKVTNRYDDNKNPLYFKEVIQKDNGDTLQVVCKGEILFDGFELVTDDKEFVLYHSFEKDDNTYCVLRKKVSGESTSIIEKVPLCHNPVIDPSSIKVDEQSKTLKIDGKTPLGIKTQMVRSDTRGGTEIEYSITGKAVIDIYNQQNIFNLGVVIEDNQSKQDAYLFIQKFLRWNDANQQSVKFQDPLNQHYIISKQDIAQYGHLYDVLIWYGYTENDNTAPDSCLNICTEAKDRNGAVEDYILGKCEDYFGEYQFGLHGFKDIIYPRNVLFENEYSVIGYELFNTNSIDYAKKIITYNPVEYVGSYIKYKVEDVPDLKVDIARYGHDNPENNPIQQIYNNTEISFYSTKLATQNLYDTSYHCIVQNVSHQYTIHIVLSANNIVNQRSKSIDVSYIPRKQYIPINTLVSFDALKSILEQDPNASLSILHSAPLNLVLYDTSTHSYLSDAKSLTISVKTLLDDKRDIMLEASEINYSLNIANNTLSIASENAFADSIFMPKSLKAYQNWSPMIKNMGFYRETPSGTYHYQTTEFFNQSFYGKNSCLKKVFKEECESAGEFALQLQHQYLDRGQSIQIQGEQLIQVNDNLFICQHPIDESKEIKITNLSDVEVNSSSYQIQGNFIVFTEAQTDTTQQGYKISYFYNYLKVYGLSTEVKSIQYAHTTTVSNLEYTRKLLNFDGYVFYDANNISLFTKDADGEFRAIDTDKYYIDPVSNSIILKFKDGDEIQDELMRSTIFVSGLITRKIEYTPTFINYESGVIYTKEEVDFRDTIFADYIYEAKEFELYCLEDDVLDLNPLRGHYSAYNGQTFAGKDLINRKCFIVLFPYQTTINGKTRTSDEATTRFTFNEAEADLWVKMYKAIKLGSICLVNNFDLSDISILDARSLGGGLKEKYSATDVPAARFWHDVEDKHEQLYRPGGLLIVRLPMQLLKEYGGVLDRDYVEATVSNYQPTGCHYKIEFYDIFKEDLINPADFEDPKLTKQDLINKYLTYRARD